MTTRPLKNSWGTEELGNVCEIVMGQSPPSSTYNYDRRGTPFLQGKAEFTEVHPQAEKFCTLPLKIAKRGRVLMSVRAPVGDVNLADKDYAIGRGLAALSMRGGDNRFLFYSLTYHRADIESLGSGTTFHSVNKSSLHGLSIHIPPICEQRAIVRALDTVQQARDARQRELNLERERKAALMEYLFTHGTRGEPTQRTKIGEIPESWQVVELGEVARIGNGSTPRRSDERYWKAGTIPWITSTQIHDVVIQRANELVTDTARKECHLPLVPKGSVVVAITGQGKTLGNAALLAIDTCINQHLAYVQFKRSSVHAEFALVYLQSKYNYFRGVASGGGSTKGALTCGFLKTVSVPVPSLDEQSAISGVLLGCEKNCRSLERELAALDELLKALLEELMSGRLSATPLLEEHHSQ